MKKKIKMYEKKQKASVQLPFVILYVDGGAIMDCKLKSLFAFIDKSVQLSLNFTRYTSDCPFCILH